jgi:DNA-binding NarL/FixJ family response regulator
VVAYISQCTDISHARDNHRVQYKIFGPRHEEFDNFLETSPSERQGTNLFTEREMDVLRLLRTGHTSAEIAEELYISVNTVNTHRKSLMRKAEVDNTVELLFFAQEHGYL